MLLSGPLQTGAGRDGAVLQHLLRTLQLEVFAFIVFRRLLVRHRQGMTLRTFLICQGMRQVGFGETPDLGQFFLCEARRRDRHVRLDAKCLDRMARWRVVPRRGQAQGTAVGAQWNDGLD